MNSSARPGKETYAGPSAGVSNVWMIKQMKKRLQWYSRDIKAAETTLRSSITTGAGGNTEKGAGLQSMYMRLKYKTLELCSMPLHVATVSVVSCGRGLFSGCSYTQLLSLTH